MGRKAFFDKAMSSISARITAEEKKMIDLIAAKSGISQSDFIRDTLKTAIKKHEKKIDETRTI